MFSSSYKIAIDINFIINTNTAKTISIYNTPGKLPTQVKSNLMTGTNEVQLPASSHTGSSIIKLLNISTVEYYSLKAY